MLRARSPDTYAAVVSDLFQHDPKIYGLRSRYYRVIGKTLEEDLTRRIPQLLDQALDRIKRPSSGFRMGSVAGFCIGLLMACAITFGIPLIDQLLPSPYANAVARLPSPSLPQSYQVPRPVQRYQPGPPPLPPPTAMPTAPFPVKPAPMIDTAPIEAGPDQPPRASLWER